MEAVSFTEATLSPFNIYLFLTNQGILRTPYSVRMKVTTNRLNRVWGMLPQMGRP